MLSERQLMLLTAFVDGEMSRRQRKALLRLLHDSSEARAVLVELQDTARRLQELPRRELDGSFAREVLSALALDAQQTGKSIRA